MTGASVVPGGDEHNCPKNSKEEAWGSNLSRNSTLVDDEAAVLSLRMRAWRFLEDPASSFGARVFSICTMTVILFSVVLFCLESMPRYYAESIEEGSVWEQIETVCVVIFTVEYILRLLCCPDRLLFLIGPLNVIDLVAILPFYLEIIFDSLDGSKSAVFRVVRLVRVFRVFKFSRYMSWIRIFWEAMMQSLQPLAMLLFVMMIGCIFFSSAMFYAERGTLDEEQMLYFRHDNKLSPFQSIPDTFWWCLVTMTTVGYGDAVPITWQGKVLASITSLTGILVLAIPITIISTNFNVEYERLKRQRKNMRARIKLLKNHFKEKEPGLDTYQTEVEDLVKRSSKELLGEMEELIEASKEEMVLALQELIRLSHASRQRDLYAVASSTSKIS